MQKQPKIVYIDDNPLQRQNLTYLLSQNGIDIKTTDNGQAGIELIRRWLPDLVLLDLRMPAMSGYDIAQILRADSHTQNIPIVAYSAEYELVAKPKAEAVGINGFIPKTLPLQELLLCLQAYFEQQ